MGWCDCTPDDVFEEHWREIVCNDDDTLNEERVKAELHDFWLILTEVPKVYDHVTRGRLSNPNTAAEHVISAHDELWQLDDNHGKGGDDNER